jgi:glutathione S-transferase
MSLVLFYAPLACSLVPYVTLTEAGADFSVRVVDMGKGEQLGDDFARVNPKRKVPVLLVDGEPLTENVAIQLCIARRFPDARLLPADPMQELKAIAFMAWCASAIHPSLTPNARPERYCDLPDSAESVRRCAQRLLAQHFAVGEGALGEQDWLFGDFGAADAYYYWCFRRASQLGVDLSAFPRAQAHRARMEARPSVQRLLAFEAETKARLERA